MILRKHLLYLLFFLSGISGLIYESIWSHYLKLFLGHAAYAQAVVLGVFMGGLAIGAVWSNRLIGKWKNLILAYAVIEAIIGVAGLLFHQVFVWFLAVSYDTVLPALDSRPLVLMYKWTCACLLILPQSILLGMTFPLMSNGLLRKFPDTRGKTVSFLYFSNSLGAAVGVLLAGFVLRNLVGLPGTMMSAALLNILVAVIAYFVSKSREATALSAETADDPPTAASATRSRIPAVILLTAALTGFASFVYEITWLRSLSLVLGASTHAFELMLSVFITGLALGSLFIARKADRLRNPLKATAWIQLLMALFAACTLPLYNYTYDLMGFFMDALDRNDQGYVLFNLASHFIAALVMLPATVCAGMTLPLLTLHLSRSIGYKEKSIGSVYAANTVGSLLGVYCTVFWLMPMMGSGHALFGGALVDMLLGLGILYVCYRTVRAKSRHEQDAGHAAPRKQRFPTKGLAAAGLSCLTVAVGFMYAAPDLRFHSSTVFRYGSSALKHLAKTELLFYRDGSTSTVSVIKKFSGSEHTEEPVHSLFTNAKPDASASMAKIPRINDDETTMFLLGFLPTLLKPNANTFANIGMGSGYTTHTVLATLPQAHQVDTIEIEPAIFDAARWFLPVNRLAYEDPRSHFHVEDAKIYFADTNRQYDIIISEPSNPWVSGVSSLFTTEFYQRIRRHLKTDGLFVQWMHLYELSPELAATVINALALTFPYAHFYRNQMDLIILASGNPLPLGQYPSHFFSDPTPELANLYMRNDIRSSQDIWRRFSGDQDWYYPWAKHTSSAVNSDFFPLLDLASVHSRFTDQSTDLFQQMAAAWLPLIETWYMDSTREFHSVPDAQPYRLPHNTNMRIEKELLAWLAEGEESLWEGEPELSSELSEYRVFRKALQEPDCVIWEKTYAAWFLQNIPAVLSLALRRHADQEHSDALADLLRQSCSAEVQPTWTAWQVALLETDLLQLKQTAERLLQRDDLLPKQRRLVTSSLLFAHWSMRDYIMFIQTYEAHAQTLRDATPKWIQAALGISKQHMSSAETP